VVVGVVSSKMVLVEVVITRVDAEAKVVDDYREHATTVRRSVTGLKAATRKREIREVKQRLLLLDKITITIIEVITIIMVIMVIIITSIRIQRWQR
jgi:hypothetical protein